VQPAWFRGMSRYRVRPTIAVSITCNRVESVVSRVVSVVNRVVGVVGRVLISVSGEYYELQRYETRSRNTDTYDLVIKGQVYRTMDHGRPYPSVKAKIK